MAARALCAIGLATSALLLGALGCDSEVTTESAEAAATSCPVGVYIDSGGRCRRPNGWYASKVCCEPKVVSQRRSLATYSCSSEPGDIPVAFLDADSTLRVSKSGAPTANAADDVYVLPFAANKIKELSEQGYFIAVVSNQGGVSHGFTTVEVAEGALVYLANQLDSLGATVDYLDFADDYDNYRKPNTGMKDELDQLLNDKCGVGVDLDRSLMIGDAGYKKNVDGNHPDGRPADDFSNSDRGLAENLSIPFTEPTDAFGWRAFGTFNIHKKWELLDLYQTMEDEVLALEESGEDDERLELVRDVLESNRAVNDL